jgi:hypothetical protein
VRREPLAPVATARRPRSPVHHHLAEPRGARAGGRTRHENRAAQGLIRGGTQPGYVETGHLLYVAANALHAVRFDLGRLEPLGDPVPVVDDVMMVAANAANYAVSRWVRSFTSPRRPRGGRDRSYGSIARGRRRQSRRHRACMPSRDCRPTAHGLRSPSAIRKTTSGSGISRGRRIGARGRVEPVHAGR